MNQDKESLIKIIKELRESLAKDNNPSSSFCDEVLKKLTSADQEEEFLSILDDLKSSGTISQYGNFNSDQDKLLDTFLGKIKQIISK